MRCEAEFGDLSVETKSEVVIALVEHLASESSLDVLTLQALEVPITAIVNAVDVGDRSSLRRCAVDSGDRLTVVLDVVPTPSADVLRELAHGFFRIDVEEHVVRLAMDLP